MKAFSVDDTLTTHFQQKIAKLYTAMPCIVTNVVGELADCRVDVRPSINFLYKDGNTEEREQILSVPVVFPASLTSMFSFPINVGDTVLCVFASRSMDNFKAGTGQPTTPNDYRKMSDRDAIAIPGLFPFAKSTNNPKIRQWPHSTKDAVLVHNIATGQEVEVRLKQNGDLIINTNQDIETNSTKVTINCTTAEINATDTTLNTSTFNVNADTTTWVGDITHTGDYTQTGQSTFNGIVFATHIHGGVTSGNGTTAIPVG